MERKALVVYAAIFFIIPLLAFGQPAASSPTRPGLLPNVTIAGFRTPAKVFVGESVTLKTRVRNAGVGAAPASKLSVAFSSTPNFKDNFAAVVLDVPPLPPSSPTSEKNSSNTAWITWSTFIPETTSSVIYFIAQTENDNGSAINMRVVPPSEIMNTFANKTLSDIFHDLSATFTNLSEVFDKLQFVISGSSEKVPVATISDEPLVLLQPVSGIIAALGSVNNVNPPTYDYRFEFRYDYFDETIISFNIYRKRPTDTSFVNYAYNVRRLASSTLPALPTDIYTLVQGNSYILRWNVKLPAPVPSQALGEYQFYVTAVDENNAESPSSTMGSFTLYTAPTIISPADGSTVSRTPTISFIGGPNVMDQMYDVWLYGKTTPLHLPYRMGDRNNFIYDGPPLSSKENPYRIMVYSRDLQGGQSLWAMSTFNVENTP